MPGMLVDDQADYPPTATYFEGKFCDVYCNKKHFYSILVVAMKYGLEDDD
jgi:hypothetical protein